MRSKQNKNKEVDRLKLKEKLSDVVIINMPKDKRGELIEQTLQRQKVITAKVHVNEVQLPAEKVESWRASVSLLLSILDDRRDAQVEVHTYS
jgi:UDP-N-acetylglucosamine enolpyruvyl transferase